MAPVLNATEIENEDDLTEEEEEREFDISPQEKEVEELPETNPDALNRSDEGYVEWLQSCAPIGDQAAGTATTTPPAVTADAQQAFDERKHALEERIAKLSVEEVLLKASVKCNRESMNSTTEEYQSHIARGTERLPLFDRAAKSQGDLLDGIESTDTAAEEPAEADPAAAAATKATDTAWRDVTTEDLGIDPKICILLREAQDKPIATLGDIADFCEEYGLTDLKKIGKAKSQKIEEAMDAYWAANPRE